MPAAQICEGSLTGDKIGEVSETVRTKTNGEAALDVDRFYVNPAF